ncbi:hypothetical protein B0H16DRAFT_1743493 [Mycena metata]|uniref:RNase III domain-containing protein n=1 Tax=Mycena metata TaxID=1033252 RepID=A0AAD7H6J8_9AGAR|nr:hypothetical protein B0H16DRAFT_1743493 [Mycena metata]
MSRQTPLQAIAHLLSDDDLLRDPIETRWKISLDSTPRKLLTQLDHEEDPPWPPLALLRDIPEFPSNYPPDIPSFTKQPRRLCTAFTSGENKALEWLGDSVIEIVLALCVYGTTTLASTPVKIDFFTKLVGKDLLGHLGLLYGMQLHDFQGRPELPAMERVCDSFEAVVGASLTTFGQSADPSITAPLNPLKGFPETFKWLGPLLDPWVKIYIVESPQTFVNSDGHKKYAQAIRRFQDVPIKQLSPVHLNAESFTPRSDPSQLSVQDVRSELGGGSGRTWVHIDASRVIFPPGYPYPPPGLAELEPAAVSAAMTDVGCHLHFGVPPNTGYHTLGLRLCKMAVTKLAYDKMCLSPAQMVIIRKECLDEPLFARLGFLLKLHRHLRVLRSENDDSHFITAHQSREAFEALVGLVYLTIGWDRLFVWLEHLFLPCMEATRDGRLRASRGAQVSREEEEKRLALKDAKRTEAAVRAELEKHRKAAAIEATKVKAQTAARARASSKKFGKTRRGAKTKTKAH